MRAVVLTIRGPCLGFGICESDMNAGNPGFPGFVNTIALDVRPRPDVDLAPVTLLQWFLSSP